MALCPHCGREAGEARFCPHDGTPLAHVDGGAVAIEPTVGVLVDGRYRLLEELGSGGMGVVFRAQSEGLGEVAVKVLHPTVRPATLSRFAREARLASRIAHPSVVRVYEFGFARERFYFIVMELVRGRALRDVLADRRRMAFGRALRLLEQVSSALASAHELGIAHRDLKPENVVLTSEDGERAVLVDFGLSTAFEIASDLTRTGQVMGTPGYMAPEQWQATGSDARTDVWAFGALAYEVLAGEPPFTGENAMVVMQRTLGESAPSLLEAGVPGMLPEVARLVGVCLAREMDERPSDMRVVHERIGAIIAGGGESVLAEDPTVPDPRGSVTDVTRGEVGVLTLDELHAEVGRLTGVRRSRSAAYLRVRGADLDPLLLRAIEEQESTVARLGEELALARDRRLRAEEKLREREAALRAELMDAALRRAAAHEAVDCIEADVLEEQAPESGRDAERVERELEDVRRRSRHDELREAHRSLRARHEEAARILDERYAELDQALTKLASGGARLLHEQLEELVATIAMYRVEIVRRRSRGQS